MKLTAFLVLLGAITLFCVVALIRERRDSPRSRAQRHNRKLDRELKADRDQASNSADSD